MPKTVIDYVDSEGNTFANVPSTILVDRPGESPCLADAVVQGELVCVNGLKKVVNEVGSVVVNDDGTKEARTILSGGA